MGRRADVCVCGRVCVLLCMTPTNSIVLFDNDYLLYYF